MAESNLTVLNTLLIEITKLFFNSLNPKDDFFIIALNKLDQHYVKLSKVYDSNRKAVRDDAIHIVDALYFAIIFGKVCSHLQEEIQSNEVTPEEIFLAVSIIFLSFRVEIDFALNELDSLMFSVLENQDDVRKKISLIYSRAKIIVASKRLIEAQDNEKKEPLLPLTTTTSSVVTSSFFSGPLDKLKLFFRRCPLNISYIEINKFLRLFERLGLLSNIHSKTIDLSFNELVEFLLVNEALAGSIIKLQDEQTVLIDFIVKMTYEKIKIQTIKEEFFPKWFYLFIKLKLLFPAAQHIIIFEDDLGRMLEAYAEKLGIKDKIKLMFNLKMFIKNGSAEEYYIDDAVQKVMESYLETIFLWCSKFLEENKVELIADTILDLALEQTKELLVKMGCKDGFYLLPKIYCELCKVLNNKSVHIEDRFQSKMVDFFISILSQENLPPYDLKIISQCLLKFPSAFQKKLSEKITENLPACELSKNIPENEADWIDRLIVCKLNYLLSRSVITHDRAISIEEIDRVYLAITDITYLIKDKNKELVRKLFHDRILSLLRSITERFLAREKLLVMGMEFNEASAFNVNLLLYLLECYAQYQKCSFEDTALARAKNSLISAIFDRIINFEFNFVVPNEIESVIQMLNIINRILVKLNKFNNENSAVERIKDHVLSKILYCVQEMVNQKYSLSQVQSLMSEVREFIALSKSNPGKFLSNNKIIELIKKELAKLEFLYALLKIKMLGSNGNKKLSLKEIKILKERRNNKLDRVLLQVGSKKGEDSAVFLEYASKFFSESKGRYSYFKSTKSPSEIFSSIIDDKDITESYLFILTFIIDLMTNEKIEPELLNELDKLIQRIATVRRFDSADRLKTILVSIAQNKISSKANSETTILEVRAAEEIADGAASNAPVVGVWVPVTTITAGAVSTAVDGGVSLPDGKIAGGTANSSPPGDIGNGISSLVSAVVAGIDAAKTLTISGPTDAQSPSPAANLHNRSLNKFFRGIADMMNKASSVPPMRHCPKR